MAVGLPLKVTYADGDVYSASDVNDTNGTINLFQTSTLSRQAGKNLVINGGMDIWQRGTSVAIAASSSGYTTDRWFYAVGANQASTISRQATGDTTNLPTIQYCARVQRNSGQTGGGGVGFDCSIESVNSIPFAGQTITFSFYARRGANYSASSNILNAQVLSGTGTDQNVQAGFTGSATVISQNATLTTTWQRFTYTGTVAASATQLGIRFITTWAGTAGAADYFEVTGVQVELGSYATTFSRAGGTIQGELAACQRYYYRTSEDGNYQGHGNGFAWNTTSAMIFVKVPVTMRINPTVLEYANVIMIDSSFSGGGTQTLTINSGESSRNLVNITTGNATGLTGNRPAYLRNNNTTAGYIGISAEL
jgi:hypothetical protein